MSPYLVGFSWFNIVMAAIFVPIAGFWLGRRLQKIKQLDLTSFTLILMSFIALFITFLQTTLYISDGFRGIYFFLSLALIIILPTNFIVFGLSIFALWKGYFRWHSGLIAFLAAISTTTLVILAQMVFGVFY